MIVKDNVLFGKGELRQFCIYRFIFGISYSLMIPIIPLFFDSMGITTVMIGTIMSLYGVSKTLIQIPFGIVSDTIGDKLTIMIALLLMSFIPFAYTLASNSLLISSICILQGAILGMAAPATFSILSRSLDGKKRGQSTGLASAVFTIGGGIGAAISGLIVAKLGNYNMVFYISSIGIFITLIYVTLQIRKSNLIYVKEKFNRHRNKSRRKEIFEEIKKYNLKYKIIVLGTIAFLGDFIYGCVVALFHFYGKDVLGTSTVYTSAMISIYLMIFGLGAPVAGFVSDKIGNKKQLFISFAVMNITLLGLAFTRNVAYFTIIIIIYFLGATFLNASLQSSLSEFGDNHKIKGIVFGFVGASESLGYALGPMISAYIYRINKSWLFLGLLVVSILVSVIYLFLHKKARI
ncbi:MFS transporter [Clostridium gasigenes]|uniref:Sugar phosphate permease n=1 Tax=Clostridium gasigenes TaxID=94869 RepID=A0A1H0NYP4_9CLOT|nr:MFS transporter [Clostridium gasigenes]SDO97555.1 Sugar phosphate permease [Clostridium gasigenes]